MIISKCNNLILIHLVISFLILASEAFPPFAIDYEESHVRRCYSELRSPLSSSLFFYTYEAIEHECTVHCYWFKSEVNQLFFDATVKRTYYNNGLQCIDGNHECAYGQCVEKNRQIDNSTPRKEYSKKGGVLLVIRDGYFQVEDGRSKGDPYITFNHKGKTYKTKTKSNTWNVRFNEEFNLPDLDIDDFIKLVVMDKDKHVDDRIGIIKINIRKVLEDGNDGKFVKYPVGNKMDWLEIRISWIGR